MYCTGCGTQVTEGARFCTACGTAVTAPTPMPSAGGERVVAVIPSTRLKAGLIKRVDHTLVLTDRRIIFARITPEMLKQAVADAREGAKTEGKGFFGQWGAQLRAYGALAEGYLVMPPEVTLTEHPENFAIERQAISEAKVRAGRHHDDDQKPTPDRLVLKTTAGKYDIELQQGAAQAKQALKAAGML